MSTFSDLYTNAARPLLEELAGESITYTPRGGAGSSVTGLVEEERDDDGVVRRIYSLSPSDASDPKRGDQITEGSTTYLATEVEETSFWVRLTAEETQSVTYTQRTATSGSSINVVVVEQSDTDEQVRRRFVTSSADVSSPAEGDRITDGDSDVWVVQDVSELADGLIELDCAIVRDRG